MNSLHILSAYSGYAYPILFILMLIEGGDGTLLASGFLIRLDFLNFYYVLPLALVGAFMRDVFLYKIGSRYGEKFIERFGRFFSITPERFIKIEEHLKKRRGRTIFISKFMYGLNYITILAVGAIKVNFKRFIKIDALTIFVWALIMIALGFTLGHSFTLLRHYIKDISIFLIIVALLFILLELFIRKMAKSYVPNSKSNFILIPLAIIAAGLMVAGGMLWQNRLALKNKNAVFSQLINSKPEIGSPAPFFALKDINGITVSTEDLKGQDILLVFWSTNCQFCAQELPDLKNFAQQYRGLVTVVAITYKEPAPAVKDYEDKEKIDFAVLLDASGDVASQYRIEGTPAHFFINKDGKIVSMWPSATSFYNLELVTKDLFAQKKF
jgi:membrane protein DedA with SNARE-associated domain/peroxiredoxin